MNNREQRMDLWSRVGWFLLLGYSLGGRAFSYIGIPSLKLFIGEIALASFLVFQSRYVFRQWFTALVKTIPFTALAWCLLLSLIYGIIEIYRGVALGYKPLTAAQNLVFNIYPLYLFLGIWLGLRHPELMPRLVRIVAWYSCFYGPAYLLFLQHVRWTMPGSDATIFGQSGGSFQLIGLFCLERNLWKYWLPITVAAFMMLATQVRAEWLGFAIMLLIWGILGKKMGKVFSVAGIIAVLLVIGFVSDFTLPSTAERGGAVSSREIVARGLSAFSQDLASEYSSTKNVRFYAGTIYWRARWWHEIWENINQSTTKQLVGEGYGYPLSSLVPDLKGLDIRTPHNVFFFCLAYSGWLGVVLFVWLQLSIFYLLWRAYKRTNQPLGLCIWASTVAGAFFGNVFETPFGAIPSYLMIGLLLVPGLQGDGWRRVRYYYATRPARPAPRNPVPSRDTSHVAVAAPADQD